VKELFAYSDDVRPSPTGWAMKMLATQPGADTAAAVADAISRRPALKSERRELATTGEMNDAFDVGTRRFHFRPLRRWIFSARETRRHLSTCLAPYHFSRSRAAGGANVQFVGRNAYYGMRLALSIEASHNVRIIKSTVDCFVIACPILFGLVITH